MELLTDVNRQPLTCREGDETEIQDGKQDFNDKKQARGQGATTAAAA